jgi:hypothetical protein
VKFILAVCAVAGLYFVLNHFPSLHTSVVGHLFGLTFTWFHVLFFGGSAAFLTAGVK